MADVSDVEKALVAIAAQAVYPNGSAQPSAIGNPAFRIYRGWPTPGKGAGQLDADLAAEISHISVYPLDIEKRTTRYGNDWQEILPRPVPGITITAGDTTLTVGGTPGICNVAVLVNGKGYIHSAGATETPTQVATALAALINVDTPATNTGAVITIPAAYKLAGRIGAIGNMIREIRRQRRHFMISCWCPTPAIRDGIAPIIDISLSDYDFINLPDGSCGRILYEHSRISDKSEKELCYRRDLIYSVDFPTTESQTAAEILVELLNVYGQVISTDTLIKTLTI